MLTIVDNFKEEEEPRKIYSVPVLTTILEQREPTVNHLAVWSQKNFWWSKLSNKAIKTMWLTVIVTK